MIRLIKTENHLVFFVFLPEQYEKEYVEEVVHNIVGVPIEKC